MELQDIFNEGRSLGDIINDLKSKSVIVPKWEDVEKQYDPQKHPIITDKSLRPDNKVDASGKKEVVARITYTAEKIASRRMTQMAFAIPVKRLYSTTNESGDEDKTKKAQKAAMEAIYKHVRIDGVNVNRMKAYFSACEMMTVWYVVEGNQVHNKYGFPTRFKLRCRSYSPMPEKWSRITQASLYPFFDEYEDMIAMSFEYERVEGESTTTYFETYTSEMHYKWKIGEDDWEEAITPEKITIGKIPVAYLWRPMPIWEETSNNREEIEFTLSRNSDVIRKNSAPIVKIKGQVLGDAPVGDRAREVYNVEAGGDIDLVSPAISSEAVKYHISQMKQNIEEELQLPNLSMENVKGLGAISGESRKTLLTDAHLKVGDERHEIVLFLDRESSVIKALLGEVNTKWKGSLEDLDIEHQITPFIQNDKQAKVKELIDATGGKQIKSQKTAIEELADVEDPDKELEQIRKEEAESAGVQRSIDVFTSGV